MTSAGTRNLISTSGLVPNLPHRSSAIAALERVSDVDDRRLARRRGVHGCIVPSASAVADTRISRIFDDPLRQRTRVQSSTTTKSITNTRSAFAITNRDGDSNLRDGNDPWAPHSSCRPRRGVARWRLPDRIHDGNSAAIAFTITTTGRKVESRPVVAMGAADAGKGRPLAVAARSHGILHRASPPLASNTARGSKKADSADTRCAPSLASLEPRLEPWANCQELEASWEGETSTQPRLQPCRRPLAILSQHKCSVIR
ncbi:hypothetical protein EJ02DRAFT_184567 [Clathrospora elynae]|uniref:Uncharacterized protein n=1 Tax=Clathrospora elynae TaxID=706981 RepID=A0A6A5SU52_9PLEO|nr:hypothetical protein EJ02DRAFT_184567 [Clathrospora elynae]